MDDAMLDLARQAMSRAHAPYSKFQVGAVIKAANGKHYAGCNVENAAYPEGWCAETSAIAAMVMDGETRISEIAVMGRGEGLVTPCGGCRQRIREFADDATPVHVCDENGVRRTLLLGELLPLSFGPENLEK
jgi:cytidine deaminase